jgi:PKD repeat protein
MLPLVLRGLGGASVSVSLQSGAGAVTITAGAQPMMMGTVTDGSGVRDVGIMVHDPLGRVQTFVVSVTDGAWAFEPDLTGWAVGAYTLRVRAVDIYGNVRMAGPYPLEVQDAPIVGLTATNDSPRPIDQEVAFGATITGGSNVAYTWDFGDGVTDVGRTVTHAYSEHGAYTATVTATNSASTVQTTTSVTILTLSVGAGDD